MSFRSRATRSSQPLNRRRSLSSSRVPPSTNNSSNPYIAASTRPLSSIVYPSSYGSNTSNNIRSSYGNISTNSYGSRESLYSPTARNSFFSSNNAIGGGGSSRRDSYGSSNNLNSKYGTGTSSTYKSPYSGDRYVSPYSTSYENGITVAGLNLSSYSPNAYTPKTANNYKVNTSISSSTNSNNNNNNRLSSLSNSNVSKNPKKSLKVNASTSTSSTTTSNGSIHNSHDDDDITSQQQRNGIDRKSRNSKRELRNTSTKRSLSATSDRSEGYESGSERTSRSRLGSNSSQGSENEIKHVSLESSENGETIDYKVLYEAARAENDKLKLQMKKKDDELINAKATVDRFTNATTKNSLSELEKRERRAMERKLSEMEEELKLLHNIRSENERLRSENRALTRVVSKLTNSAQSQLQHKQ